MFDDDLSDLRALATDDDRETVCGEARRLAIGIVRSIVEDLRSRWPEIRREAREWITLPEEGPCGIEWCATALGMETEDLARRLKRHVRLEVECETSSVAAPGIRQIDLVLNAVRGGATTSAQVRERTGLSATACAAYLSALLKSGLVVRTGEAEGKRGRKMNLYAPAAAREDAAA